MTRRGGWGSFWVVLGPMATMAPPRVGSMASSGLLSVRLVTQYCVVQFAPQMLSIWKR